MRGGETMYELSYLVPSFNRQYFLRRLVFSLSDYNVEVIIVDGSREDWGNGLRGCLRRLDWKYIHMPGELNYFERLKVGLENASGHYVCILDDQDMFFPNVHFELIRESKKLSGFISVACAMAGLDYKQDFPKLVKLGHYSEPFEAKQENGLSRVKSVIENKRTASFYYQPIQKKYLEEFLEAVLPVIKRRRPEWLGWAEFAFAIFLANKGYLVVRKDIGWVRRINPHHHVREFREEIKLWPSEYDIDALFEIFKNSSEDSISQISDNKESFTKILKQSHEFMLPQNPILITKITRIVLKLPRYVWEQFKTKLLKLARKLFLNLNLKSFHPRCRK